MKWEYILNIDTIAVIFLIIAVIYCLYRNWGKTNTYDFQGIGESGWDISEGKKYWDYDIPRKKWRKKRKYNKHEERCREIFQDIYGHKFKSVRPNWLRNPVTNKNLELDGFCEHIRTPKGKGLAFEYDGVQHSRYNKHFHRHGPDEFIYQCKKDSWKDVRCKEKGVMLVRIPHFVAYEDLERYITDKLEKYKILPSTYRRGPKPYNKNGKKRRFDPMIFSAPGMKSNNSGFLSGLYG